MDPVTRPWLIAPLAAEHTRGLAECHIECWREAYRGLVPDHILAAFDVDHRADQWERRRLRYPSATHLGLVDDKVIGFASAGPARDPDPATAVELHAIYVRTAWHGTGIADELIRTAIDPEIPCHLWVFEENPRAHAFYRRHGFVLDGARRIEAFAPITEVRMVRGWDAQSNPR